ncbi:hypothetical protein GALMADRAFT_39294, partial [Galerina marginata CBS 339.88]
IVEEFDDDTDLPLPSQPLPNTGSRGPLLEEMHISDDEFEPHINSKAGPASPRYQGRPDSASKEAITASSANANRVTDITPYKNWTCIYPIYIDAKRPYGTGQRRVQRAKSLWWPLSKDIADAASRLGLGTLHEVNKAHPRDWENPGRVRVQWKKDDKLINPAIKTKKQLLEMVCLQIQLLKPENVPKPPYTTSNAPTSVLSPNNSTTPATPPTSTPSKDKGKQTVSSSLAKSKALSASSTSTRAGGRKLPVPPEPLPSLANRVSPYSPALSSGVLIETVKAGMNATDSAGAAGAGAPGAGGAGPGAGAKGKRKVVRVR